MTDNNLQEHLDEMQHRAGAVQSLLEAFMYLQRATVIPDPKEREDTTYNIIETAYRIAKSVNGGLDSVNLPKGELS